jgi:uncharacterized membrane protein YkoI
MRAFLLSSLAVMLLATTAVAEKVELSKVPAKATDAVKKRFPGAKMIGATSSTADGKTVYEISIEDKDAKIDVTVTADGVIQVIEKTLAAKDLPKPVAAAVEGKFPKSTYKKIEEVTTVKDGKEKLDFYEIVIETAEKKTVELEVAPDGKILKTTDK